MKKNLGIISLLSVSLAMVCGVFSSLNTKASKANAVQEEVASDIYGIQIRSDHVNSNYLVIRDSQIDITYPAESTGYTSIYNTEMAAEYYKYYFDEYKAAGEERCHETSGSRCTQVLCGYSSQRTSGSQESGHRSTSGERRRRYRNARSFLQGD